MSTGIEKEDWVSLFILSSRSSVWFAVCLTLYLINYSVFFRFAIILVSILTTPVDSERLVGNP